MGFGFNIGGSKNKQESNQERNQNITGTSSGNVSGTNQTSFWTPDQQNLAGMLSNMMLGSMGGQQANQTSDMIAKFQGGLKGVKGAFRRAATGQGYENIVDPTAANNMYAAIEKQTLEDILPKSAAALSKNANMAGMLRSGPALKMQLENQGQIVNELSKTLSGLRYSDEQQRRQIAQDREGRQMAGAQGLMGVRQAQINAGLVNPQQNQINNILSMLGIRGTTNQTTDQNTSQNMTQILQDYLKSNGKNSGMSGGFNASFL